jgi:septal ring factor EnvC (AmiA/AmiB activator)
MTIELTILISSVSVAFAIYFGISNVKRNRAADERKDASEMTTVIVKLENIGETMMEVKRDLNALRSELHATSERLVRLEESTKQAHKRIDTLERRLQEYIRREASDEDA